MSIITAAGRRREIPAFDLYDLSAAAPPDPPSTPPPPVALDMADEPPRMGPVPFDQLVAELKAIYAPGLAAPATWQKLEGVLKEVKAMGVTSTAELTVPLVARYVSSRPPGQSSHTLLSVLSSLRAACSYAESYGYVRVSPFRVKKLSKWVRSTPPREHLHLSRDHIRLVLDRLRQDVAEQAGWPQWRSRRDLAVAAIIAFCAEKERMSPSPRGRRRSCRPSHTNCGPH